MPLSNGTVNTFFKENRTWCSLFYGAAGTGKTILAASGQHHKELANVGFIDADPGLVSIVGYDENIQKIGFDQVRELLSLPRYLKQMLPDVHTVVFDTITAVAGKRLTELSEQGFSSGKRGQDELQIQDYKVVTGNIEKLIATMRSAGYSVIMTAGVKDEYNMETQKLIVRRPDLPPELSRRMAHIADHIWHFHITADQSFNILYQPITTADGGKIEAKTRNPLFVSNLHKLDRQGIPNNIVIGKVNDDKNKYPDLATFYDLLLKAIDNGS